MARLEGTRFEEERGYYKTMAAEMDELGWKKAARVARIRFSSRAHALTLLPKGGHGEEMAGCEEPCRSCGEVRSNGWREEHTPG